MLHADSQREGFGFELPAVAVKELVDVARRMACGQQHGTPFVGVAACAAHAFHAAGQAVEEEPRHPLAEMHLAAVALDGGADVGDDAAQAVGADMGVGVDHYIGVGAVFDEFAHYCSDVAALGGAGVELAVAVGAGAAFAETPVAVAIDAAAANHLCDVLAALVDTFAAFHDDGLEPQFEGAQRRKQTCRAGTDDDHRAAVATVAIGRMVVGRGVAFAGKVHIGLAAVAHTAARVEAAAHYLDVAYLFGGNANPTACRGFEQMFGEIFFGCEIQFNPFHSVLLYPSNVNPSIKVRVLMKSTERV